MGDAGVGVAVDRLELNLYMHSMFVDSKKKVYYVCVCVCVSDEKVGSFFGQSA